MVVVALVFVLLIMVLKSVSIKITCLPYSDSATCVYRINSSHYYDAERGCNEIYDGKLVYGDAARYFTNSEHSDVFIQWIGLRYVDDNKVLQWSDNTILQINSTDPVWSTEENADLAQSSDRCVAVYERKWFVVDCLIRLYYALCQRPKRSKCHQWQVTNPCVWIDEECVEETFHYNHEADESGADKCQDLKETTTKTLCANSSECKNCKLSVWSPWSSCFSCDTVKSRHRYIIEQADLYYCDETYLNLHEHATCYSPCETTVDEPKGAIPVVTDYPDDDETESEEPEYSDVIFHWIIIVVVVFVCGCGVILALVIYQKLQRKYEFHRKFFTPSSEPAGSQVCEAKCTHKDSSQICQCKTVSVTVSNSLDKLGFWCH